MTSYLIAKATLRIDLDNGIGLDVLLSIAAVICDRSRREIYIVTHNVSAPGKARISLLRARQKGRIRLLRIGTRALYDVEQLQEFLTTCQRNGKKHNTREAA